MWPMVRMKHESAHKIQKLPHYSKPLAQKPQPTYLIYLTDPEVSGPEPFDRLP